MHVVFVLNGKKTVDISVQFHIQVQITNLFDNYLGQIHAHVYTVELEIKDTTESNTSASLWMGGTVNYTLPVTGMTNGDDFNFHITNFLFLSSNYNFISHISARASSSYRCFILRATLLSNKLSNSGAPRNA